jgi:hypothetical protein
MNFKYTLLKRKHDELHHMYDDREISDMVSSLFTFICNKIEKGTSDLTDQIIEDVFIFCNTSFNKINKITCQTYIDGIKDKLWDDDNAFLLSKLSANEVVGFGDFNLKSYIYYMFKTKRLSELKKLPFIKVVDLAIDCIESPELYNPYHVYKRLVHDIFEKSLFTGCPSLNKILNSSESIDSNLKSLLISHDTINNVCISKKNREIENTLKVNVLRRLSQPDNVYNHDDVCKHITTYESSSKITLNKEQIDGIHVALAKSLSFITGSAGTGKTTLFDGFSYIFKQLYPLTKIIYTAISGKAVMVLKKYIGDSKNRYFMTLAKLSKTIIEPGSYVICDEASMIGYTHLNMLIKKFSQNIILVGDIKQALPIKSVGQAFTSLIDKPYCVNNVIRLTRILRQKEGSGVLNLIHEYTSKKKEHITLEPYTNQTEGVYFKEVEDDTELATFYIEFNKTFPNMIGVQSQKVDDININIQLVVNKKKKAHKIYNKKFYVGDKVMRIQNLIIETDNIYTPNGAGGRITYIDGSVYHIEYDDPMFKSEEVLKEVFINEFKLNYIQTIHKNQGSSAEQVLLHVPNNAAYSYNLMNYRIPGRKNLLYTGLSRAKSLLVIVGDSLNVLNINKNADFFVPIDNLDIAEPS